jgi:hypothetical protein
MQFVHVVLLCCIFDRTNYTYQGMHVRPAPAYISPPAAFQPLQEIQAQRREFASSRSSSELSLPSRGQGLVRERSDIREEAYLTYTF